MVFDLARLAFEELKRVVTQPPILALPDFTKPFTVECDASGIGLGAVLMQDGRLIVFSIKALKGRNLLLSTYEKELLALVIAVQKWRPTVWVSPLRPGLTNKLLSFFRNKK